MGQKKQTFKKLILSTEKVLMIANEFEACKAGVYNALAFRSNSKRAQAIRERARELGAAEQITTGVMC